MPDHIQRLAGLARAAQQSAEWISIHEGIGAEQRAPIMRLNDALVAELGPDVGGRAFSMWFITHEPIKACITAALAEPPGGWPQPQSGLGAPSARGRRSQLPKRYRAADADG